MFAAERIFPGLLLILLVSPPAESFRIGRYRVTLRRICKEVDCRWGGWSGWNTCNHPCGSAGVETRSRGVSRKDKCGGRGCSGPSSESRSCNRGCPHGGTAQDGYCSNCPRGFYGTCCEHACEKIANCAQLECSSATDHRCTRCQSDHGGEKKAYRLASSGGHANRICEQLCSWRSDSSFCFPGTCPDLKQNCQCAEGFGSTNCLTISTKPTINYCLVTAGDGTNKVDISCDEATNAAVYTNIRATTLTIDLRSAFKGPSTSRRYYINAFKVGITEGKLNHRLERGGRTVNDKAVDCSGGSSRSNPNLGLVSCNKQDSVQNTPLQHGDRLHFTALAKNGGYVKINNADTGSIDPPKYYTGQTVTHSALLVIDLVKPVHCSIGSTCTDNMLDRGQPITKSASLTVRWAGWSDALAGIKLYEIEIYRMRVYHDKLAHHGEAALVLKSLDPSESSFSITLVDPGVYAVLLTAEDNASNHQVARRFLIFDSNSSISTYSDDDKQLRVTTAAKNTSYTWLTSLQDSSNAGQKVDVAWKGHYANELQDSQGFLLGIAAHSAPIDADYEETTGQPPDTLSRQAIPNVKAIVKYELAHSVDHQGGRSLTAPGSWVNVAAFQSETMTIDMPRADGDSVRVWVRATDVMGNTKTDSVLVHVDSSPPVIQDVWLSRHGRTQLAVHHSVELFDLKFEFDSYDFHSGLREIHWRLHDLLHPDVLHGSGQVAVQRHKGATSACTAPSCYCIPKDNECFLRNFEIKPDMSKMNKSHGDHDFDYQLVLNATNNALLYTIFTYKITIDTTAPQPGVVSDSEQSQPDIDFQQSYTQHASWQGFFDRESGIVFYQYAFSDSCLLSTNFTLPASGKVTETTLTYASRTLSGPGTYHCTVVAYNKALEPSEPVCSDGVTVDTTAPEIHQVSIENSWTKDGLVKDSTGHVWYIGRKRFRVQVDEPSDSCRQKSRLVSDTQLYRIRPMQNTSGESSVTLCQKPAFPDKPTIIISNENMLELSWFGSDDESGIHTFEVGLSSTGYEGMDVLSYTSTHGHRHFITYHPDLMDGKTFYIHIKAVNKAGQLNIEAIGPVLVRVEAPSFTGDITVSVQQLGGSKYLVAEWPNSSFSANDLQGDLIYDYSYAVGHIRGTDNVKVFSSFSRDSDIPGVCTYTNPPTCIAIPLDNLQWRLHGRHTYYVTLKLEGVNSRERVASSKAYEHYIGAPYGGLVVEIPVDTAELFSEDIDHQSSETRLHVAWYGFQHVDQPISYELAVGTAPGKGDVDGFKEVDSLSKMVTNLSLESFKTYYASVRATTPDGSTVVSSDGVTILPVDMPLEGATVMDAKPCHLSDSHTKLTTSHHDSVLPDKLCDVDVDFQSSVTNMGIMWSLPTKVIHFVTNVKWGIQEYNSSQWTVFREATDAGRVSHVIATDLHLEPGHRYRAFVQFCHPDGCFQPLHSDGVTITPDVPQSKGITFASLVGTNLSFVWSPFFYPSTISPSVSAAYRHEWTLLIQHTQGNSPEHIYPWKRITHSGVNHLGSYTTRLVEPLETSSCVVLALRAYSKVGLYSTITCQLRGCDVTSKVRLTVLDAVATKLHGDIGLEKNGLWEFPDREYTPSSSTLSAVWPDLRHGTYHWKIVSNDAIRRLAYVQPQMAPDYSDYDCSAPEVMACGVTQDNFVNVRGLSLKEGQRYHICILANATDLMFEKFTNHLEQNSECSNGIVVDTTPPIAGLVWIGSHQKHWRFQIDRSQLNIYWSSFIDVETYGHSSHHSGVLKYAYAIGTSPEGVDVRDYVDVGVTNMAVATGLTLQDGRTYFVTVRATDHVGKSTTAQSPGVTIDSTHPNITGVQVDVGGAYTTVRTEISAAWDGVFDDPESGIARYGWCLGSKPGYCDTMSYVDTTEPEASSVPNVGLRLTDGHPIYVTVQAVNRVGLTAVITSRAVIVDASAPFAGHVYDITSVTQTKDIDYTTVSSEIGAIWSGFHDPHSHITGYSVNIGKCPTCEDILERSHVGVSTSVHLSHVTLEHGVTYYTTVEACNGAGLCVTVTSDGVIADTSPPVAGDMFDGISAEDIDYQSSRSTLSAHWLNFQDPESGLLYMEWWAGTAPGHGDILAPTRLHVTDEATRTLKQQLPLRKKLYITLKVFNKAGLSTETTSNGFIVDVTPAVEMSRVSLNREFGSLKPNTQIWKSSLNVMWKMSDPESAIVEQFVSLTTRDSIHHNVPAAKLYGNEQEYTFTNVSLVDGEIYYAKVIACNGARLCTTSVSEGILVDNTSPAAGAFAVETEHAAALTRHRLGWMTYNGATLRLAWLGFNDAHCDVTTYYVTVSKTFGASDMLSGNKSVVVAHVTDDQHGDEGFVQKTEVSVTSAIQQNQQLYVSIWAENKVGLVSSRLHGTFTAMPSQSAAGTLALVRRCQPVTCQGHCTCAPHGQLTCKSTTRCNDVKGKSGYRQLSIYDIEDYTVTPGLSVPDIDFTRSQCALAATWRTATTTGKAPGRYEWSVGVEGEPMGHELLDIVREPLWRETGHTNMALYTTGSSRKSGITLETHRKYLVYVRAWYDADTYAVYVTDGVKTDSSPPSLSRSYKVTELQSDTSNCDVDFLTSTTNVTVSWRNVFRDSNAAIKRYVVSVSKTLGGNDVAEKQLTSSMTKATLTGLTLDTSDVYYSKVVAYNEACLSRPAYSDGFKVDVTSPITGLVWDGQGLADQDYSPDNQTVSAWWRGFSDDESFVDHYEWCVGTQPSKQDIVTCRNVGLHTRSTAQLSTAQSPGTRLYSTVYAFNAAGLKSAGVSSDGFVIDSTPPAVLHKFRLGPNLLKNPSFEDVVHKKEAIPNEWQVLGQIYVTASAGVVSARDGKTFLDIVSGNVKQNVATTKLKKYRFIFFVRAPDNVRFHSQQLGYVRLPGVNVAFVVEPMTSGEQWQKHVHYFTARDSVSTFKIGAIGDKTGFLLDNVRVQEVGGGRRSPSTDPRDPVNSHVQPMHVHVTSRGSYSAVTAAWDVEDPESPVISYSWAIGTVRGGLQLQNFRSVGLQTYACADALLLQHGTAVHVTIVAENAAGLRTVIYSDPLAVDLTPPDLCCLVDGGSGHDVAYQTSRTLSVTWTVKDPESDVKYCEWAIGKSPGSQEVQSFTRMTSLSTASVTLDASVSHGETIFSVVRCFNYAHLQSTLVSSGVVMVISPPDVSMATLNIITSSASYYSSRDNHLSDRDRLYFGWEGVRDQSGISSYEISIQRKNSVFVLPWKTMPFAHQLFVELQHLGLESYTTYTLMFRATNNAHLRSDVIASNFTIETEAPRMTNVSLQSDWPQQWILKLDWTGLFTSNSSLAYEINIGLTRGGIDVLSGLETTKPDLEITGVDHTKEHHVTVTAFNKAGLYTTSDSVVSYKSPSGNE